MKQKNFILFLVVSLFFTKVYGDAPSNKAIPEIDSLLGIAEARLLVKPSEADSLTSLAYRLAVSPAEQLRVYNALHAFSQRLAASGDHVNAYKFLEKYETLKENNDAELKSAQDDEVKTIVKMFLLPFLVSFSFIVFVLYRKRRESFFKQKEAELDLEISQTAMKALRAQINPHFIFNCLSSIYNSLENKNTELAGQYIMKFSKLIRSILENSRHNEIPVKEDMDTLELYIQIEQLRARNSFTYSVSIDPSIDIENTLVPPLIIQPFVENCIVHGMKTVERNGKISIALSKEGNMLKFIIEDNGEESGEPSSADHSGLVKKTSMGMAITRERLELVDRLNGTNSYFCVKDIKDDQDNYLGKRVELIMPVLN